MLTATDLALVRDEIGVSTPPTDDELHTWHTELGAWRLVALRVLKRRRADLLETAASAYAAESTSTPGVSSIAVPGAISVGFATGGSSRAGSLAGTLAALDRQIARLEAAGVTSTRLYREGLGRR